MSEHLPECPMTTEDAICCALVCICDALRACEERVLEAAVQRVEALDWDINTGMDFGISEVIAAIKGDAP